MASRLIASAASRLMGWADTRRLRSQAWPYNDIVQRLDLPYRAGGDQGHLLDVYYPASAEGKLPTIVNIHGGGLFYGSKELNRNFNCELAGRGFAVISLNYRLLPQVKVHEQVGDVLDALRFIEQSAARWPCDLDSLFVVGDSAGGLLALMVTVVNSSHGLAAEFALVGTGLRIQALGLISPMFDTVRRDLLSFITPMVVSGQQAHQGAYTYLLNPARALAEADLPPCWIVTSADDLLLHKDSHKLRTELERLHVPHSLVDWPRGGRERLGHILPCAEPKAH